MITVTKLDASTKGSEYFIGEIRGLSTDTKSEKIGDINVGNGCQFIEMDTGKIYFYDAQNERWLEFGVEAEPIVSNNEEEPQGNE